MLVAILLQHALERAERGVLLGERDDELGQVLVVDAQMVVELGAQLGDQREVLQLLNLGRHFRERLDL